MKRDKLIKDSRKSFLAIKSAVAILGVNVSVALTHILQNNYVIRIVKHLILNRRTFQ